MIFYLNKFLTKFFGVKLIHTNTNGIFFRVFKLKKKNNKKPVKPVLIELTGVSAVGKTTLFRKIRLFDQSMINLNDFIRGNYNLRSTLKVDKLKVYQALASLNIDDMKARDFLPTDQLRNLSWSYNILLNDAFAMKYNKSNIFISDEGLFHNFSSSIEKLSTQNPELFKELIKKRAVIYCHAPIDRIIDQLIKKQTRTGDEQPYYRADSDEQLYKNIENALNEKNEFIRFIKNHIPVLEIDTTEDLNKNLSKINMFIESFL